MTRVGIREKYSSRGWNPPQWSLHARAASFFQRRGVVKFAPSYINEVRQEFQQALQSASESYARGEISLAEYKKRLDDKVEPLRKRCEFVSTRRGNPLW